MVKLLRTLNELLSLALMYDNILCGGDAQAFGDTQFLFKIFLEGKYSLSYWSVLNKWPEMVIVISSELLNNLDPVNNPAGFMHALLTLFHEGVHLLRSSANPLLNFLNNIDLEETIVNKLTIEFAQILYGDIYLAKENNGTIAQGGEAINWLFGGANKATLLNAINWGIAEEVSLLIDNTKIAMHSQVQRFNRWVRDFFLPLVPSAKNRLRNIINLNKNLTDPYDRSLRKIYYSKLHELHQNLGGVVDYGIRFVPDEGTGFVRPSSAFPDYLR